VLYMNTFSQTISPSMRLGFVVLPPALLAEYRRRLDFYTCTVPALEQALLALSSRRATTSATCPDAQGVPACAATRC
jgi:DNA-binding transcriptional MocR family regulator